MYLGALDFSGECGVFAPQGRSVVFEQVFKQTSWLWFPHLRVEHSPMQWFGACG